MLHQLINIPRHKTFIIAFSGGVDSVAVVDFFYRGGKSFKLAYFNHGTPQADDMQKFCEAFASKRNIELLTGKIERLRDLKQSLEEFFRIERYRWLLSLGYDIVTGHHLNDAVEGYLFSCLHGNPSVMSHEIVMNYGTGAQIVWRPFLSTKKSELIDWCKKRNLSWLEDKSNVDTKYMRNLIRHSILPQALKVNPGLMKVVRKKILQKINVVSGTSSMTKTDE